MESIAENPQKSSESLDLSAEQKKKLAEHVMTNWDVANANRQKWLTDKEEGLNLYWGIRKPKDFPFKNCANLHVPLIRTIADTLHSNIMGSIDTQKPASIAPVGPEDVPKARKTEKVLNWQFSTQVDYNDMVDKIAQSTLVYGMAPVKVRYVIEKDVRGKKRFEGLRVDVLPPERFLVPADASNSNVEDMEYVIHEIPFSKSDLKKRMKAGTFDKMTDEELDRVGLTTNKAIRQEEDYLENVRAFYTGMETQDHQVPDRRYATVLEWYGYYDYNDDGIEEPCMAYILKESRKILRVVPWERARPFVLVTFSEVLHKAVGESVPDLLKDVNRELDTLHNLRVDAVVVNLIPPGFFDPVGGFNPNEVVLTPGTMIPTNGPPQNAVYFPNLNTVRPEMYREEENLFEYAERLMGAGANVQGIANSKRMSATETASIDRRSGIRFLTIFNRIRRGIRDIFKLAIALDEEHMPPEIQVRVTGLEGGAPLFETISREDLSAQLDITVNGNSILDDQAAKQEMMQVYQMGLMNPLVSSNPTSLYELTRDTLLTMNAKRVDAYLSKPSDEIPKSPDEEHNLFMQEEYVDPNIRENYDDHLEKHAEVINDPDKFKLLSKNGQAMLIRHYADTRLMKQQIEQYQMMLRLQSVNSALLASQMSGQVVPQAMGIDPAMMQQTPTGPQTNGNKPQSSRMAPSQGPGRP